MALRPSKITSEILQTCNKYYSSRIEPTVRNKLAASAVSQKECDSEKPTFRYKISNARRRQSLPDINFQDEPSPLFADLQPSASPEFRFDFNQSKWAEKPVENSPFPESIKQKDRFPTYYSDSQKAEDKLLKCKMAMFNNATRNMSMNCIRRYSKGPAENSGSGVCKQKVGKCFKQKTKDCRIGSKTACPRLKILDCEQSKGSNCKLNYLEPNCTKKFAPYPSYSEACAENLPDDPSECQQCPWRTCDGADTIEPGKPVRNRRHYSTSCSRHLDATAGVVVGPLLPPVADVHKYICKEKCGQTKRPCKQPPGPCEVRRQKEEEKKREHDIHIPPKPKKASEDLNRMVLADRSWNSQEIVCDSFAQRLVRRPSNGKSVEDASFWSDNTGVIYFDKNLKHPNCHRKRKPKRPPGPADQDLSIEYGNAEWWTGRGKSTIVIENKDSLEKCIPNDKCQNMEIRSKQNTDCICSGPGEIRLNSICSNSNQVAPSYNLNFSSMNEIVRHLLQVLAFAEMYLKKDRKNKKIRGDEGHPPPCEDKTGESLNCPEKPIQKSKYKKRPMSQGSYKKPEDPYTPSE